MPAPVLQALLVADQIYQDQATGKFIICGIFGTIFFHPTEVQKPALEHDEGGAGDEPLSGVSEDLASGSVPGGGSAASVGPVAGGGPAGHTGHREPAQPQPINRLIRAGSPHAYVSLAEVRGKKLFQLRYVDLNENIELFSTQFGVECRDPLETIQISIPLPTLPVPHEGVFALELLCEGELLGSHRVLARIHPKA